MLAGMVKSSASLTGLLIPPKTAASNTTATASARAGRSSDHTSNPSFVHYGLGDGHDGRDSSAVSGSPAHDALRRG
jgi:hypothetical protein